ncbi:helix-turn-helix protein [Photorhabdus khanii NC19]|uniref:Helix-turn-helix protein n=1 Tax=Photorhabdus khanii NC19 TaxID=1004151 RepID=W3V8P6_9GAMM|nr:helix-turn-helix domain-containing protein [Photorhabdus khanii]ETS32178.1 helix-turn-helix protein [Photorhabdus khanii NC19]
MLRATKVRIYPTPEQAEYLNAQCGTVCVQPGSAYQKTRLETAWRKFKSTERSETAACCRKEIT